jgi:hypothetical protein
VSDIPTSELRRILRLLRADPVLAKAVAIEMRRQRAEQERHAETIAKIVAAGIAPIAAGIAALDRTLDDIQRHDEQRRRLAAWPHLGAPRNGHGPHQDLRK